jgi:hypothetical protein
VHVELIALEEVAFPFDLMAGGGKSVADALDSGFLLPDLDLVPRRQPAGLFVLPLARIQGRSSLVNSQPRRGVVQSKENGAGGDGLVLFNVDAHDPSWKDRSQRDDAARHVDVAEADDDLRGRGRRRRSGACQSATETPLRPADRCG